MKITAGIIFILLGWVLSRPGDVCGQESPGIFAPFIDHVNAMTTNYIELKDALVNNNGTQAAKEASEFRMYLMKMKAISLDAKADKRWSKRQIKIMNVLKRIFEAHDLDTQRKAFAGLTAEMEALIDHYGPVKQTLYKQYCPRALNGAGAGWLNEKKTILNPYEGGLHCGKIVEVIKGKG